MCTLEMKKKQNYNDIRYKINHNMSKSKEFPYQLVYILGVKIYDDGVT